MTPSRHSRRARAAASALRPARLGPADFVRLGGTGLRTRPLRVFLSALGIAIGVAAMVAVVGISGSGRAEIDHKLDRLGTNMLRVAPGQSPDGRTTRLPQEAAAMIRRIGPVQQVAATGEVEGAAVYRNDRMPVGRTGSIQVAAADPELPAAIGTEVAIGRWLDRATEEYPAVVLGAQAARRLDAYTPGTRLWLGGTWFSLVGVLRPAPSRRRSTVPRWSAARRLGRICVSTGTRRPSTCVPATTGSVPYAVCWPPPRTPRSRAVCSSHVPRTRWRPARPLTPR